MIKIDKGNFYIEDNESKFGTLVFMKRHVPILGDYSNISFQIGRTMLNVTVKKNWKLMPACFSNHSADANTSGDASETEEVLGETNNSPSINRNANEAPRLNIQPTGLQQIEPQEPDGLDDEQNEDSIGSDFEGGEGDQNAPNAPNV